MTSRPRLITSIPFWILLVGSLAATVAGGWIALTKVTTMAAVMLSATAQPISDCAPTKNLRGNTRPAPATLKAIPHSIGPTRKAAGSPCRCSSRATGKETAKSSSQYAEFLQNNCFIGRAVRSIGAVPPFGSSHA